MPKRVPQPSPAPTDRRREVASILARGVSRYLRRARSGGFMHVENASNSSEIGLEVLAESRPCVVNGTRGLEPRDDGDDA